MISERAVNAIESSDTDELLRVVDGYCAGAQWERLVELRERCREALTRGKQLWGVDEHVRYRLALEAPPDYAAPVLAEGAARFALGPLPEVAASTKTWAEMDPYLEDGPHRHTFAAERVVRGEADVEEIPDLPSLLMSWEPTYSVATYKADKIETPSPKIPRTELANLDRSGDIVDDPESEGALADIVLAWTTESNGRCQVVTVGGSAENAVSSLGVGRGGLAELTPQEGLAWLAWAGASGGAHGRRRGAAAGRHGAWWAVAMIKDLDWPSEPDELGEAASSLRWHWFDDGSPSTGWRIRIALEDESAGLAWALAAGDSSD